MHKITIDDIMVLAGVENGYPVRAWKKGDLEPLTDYIFAQAGNQILLEYDDGKKIQKVEVKI